MRPASGRLLVPPSSSGHILVAENGDVQVERYWRPEPAEPSA
jgi:hypothetical protein